MTDKPRTSKTPRQRAQEAVDVLDRRLKKLRDKAKDLGDQGRAVTREITEVEKRLAYAKQNPDLPTAPQTGATA